MDQLHRRTVDSASACGVSGDSRRNRRGEYIAVKLNTVAGRSRAALRMVSAGVKQDRQWLPRVRVPLSNSRSSRPPS